MRAIPIAAGLLAAGLWASTTSAQDFELHQMKACTLVKDDAARLRCYDYALSRPASESPLVAIPQSSTDARTEVPLIAIPQSPTARTEVPTVTPPQSPTTAKSETPSFFNLRTIMQTVMPSAATKGENWQVKADKSVLEEASQLLGTLQSTEGNGTLVLWCRAKGTEAYITTRSFLGWESVRVLYRINDSQVTDSRWSASADGKGAVSSNAVEFINALNDNGTLFVRLIDYNGTDHDLSFSLGPVSDLRSQIAAVCRWPTAFPNEKAALNEPAANPQNSKAKPRAPSPTNAPLKLH